MVLARREAGSVPLTLTVKAVDRHIVVFFTILPEAGANSISDFTKPINASHKARRAQPIN